MPGSRTRRLVRAPRRNRIKAGKQDWDGWCRAGRAGPMVGSAATTHGWTLREALHLDGDGWCRVHGFPVHVTGTSERAGRPMASDFKTYRGMPRTAGTTRVKATAPKREKIKIISIGPPDPPVVRGLAKSLPRGVRAERSESATPLVSHSRLRRTAWGD